MKFHRASDPRIEIFSSTTDNRITIVSTVKAGIEEMAKSKIAAWYMLDERGNIAAERIAEKPGAVVRPARLITYPTTRHPYPAVSA